jgi:hypothetical protein
VNKVNNKMRPTEGCWVRESQAKGGQPLPAQSGTEQPLIRLLQSSLVHAQCLHVCQARLQCNMLPHLG